MNIYICIFVGNTFWSLIQRFANFLALHRAKTCSFMSTCDFYRFHYYILAFLWSSQILLQCTYISVLLLFSFYVAVPSQLYFYRLALVLLFKAQVISILCYCSYCILVLFFFLLFEACFGHCLFFY